MNLSWLADVQKSIVELTIKKSEDDKICRRWPGSNEWTMEKKDSLNLHEMCFHHWFFDKELIIWKIYLFQTAEIKLDRLSSNFFFLRI